MLWERATPNTSDVFVPMEKFMSGGSMLNLQPSSYLRLWEWREDKVNLIGATQSITVRIRYEKVLPELTLGTDPIQIRSATDPLAFATAALAARSRGARALAQDLLGTAQMATENLIERYVRPEQTKGRRRMPYSYHRRLIYLWRLPRTKAAVRVSGDYSVTTLSVTVTARDVFCAVPAIFMLVEPEGVEPKTTVLFLHPARIASARANSAKAGTALRIQRRARAADSEADSGEKRFRAAHVKTVQANIIAKSAPSATAAKRCAPVQSDGKRGKFSTRVLIGLMSPVVWNVT
jgi:hypothetical protein